MLIGADGIHSAVRRALDPAAPPPAYAGLVGNGGFAPSVPSVDAPPGHYEMIFGRRAFFGYLVAPGGEVWWFANVPHRREPARGELAEIDWRRPAARPVRRRRRPGARRDRRDAGVRADGPDLVRTRPAFLALPPGRAGRRRRTRADTDLRPGRLTVHRGRLGAGQVPARPRRARGTPSCVTRRPAARGSSPSSRPPPATTAARQRARSAGSSATRCCPQSSG